MYRSEVSSATFIKRGLFILGILNLIAIVGFVGYVWQNIDELDIEIIPLILLIFIIGGMISVIIGIFFWAFKK